MSKPFSRTMLDAVATDETKAVFSVDGTSIVPPNGYTHIIEWGTGVTAGVVEIEGCFSSASYAGTWAPVATVTYSSGSPKAEYVYSASMFPHFRHRISTAIANGTVSTKMAGAQ